MVDVNIPVDLALSSITSFHDLFAIANQEDGNLYRTCPLVLSRGSALGKDIAGSEIIAQIRKNIERGNRQERWSTCATPICCSRLPLATSLRGPGASNNEQPSLIALRSHTPRLAKPVSTCPDKTPGALVFIPSGSSAWSRDENYFVTVSIVLKAKNTYPFTSPSLGTSFAFTASLT